MVTGRPPFTGDSPVAVAYKQVHETPSPPSHVNAEVPPPLDAVVMRSLAKNPANRYQTAQEFRDDLKRSRLDQPVEAPLLMPAGAAATQVISRPQNTAVLPPQEAPPGSGRKVWLGVLIGILAVAVLAGGGYLLAKALTGGHADATTTHPVPPLIGQTQADAESALTKLHFKPSVRFRVTSASKPGRVVDQDPPAGTELREGSTVTIVVAKAPTTVPVPTLTGLTLQDAQAALTAAGLKFGGSTSGPSDTIPVDHVVSQSPAAGTQVDTNTPVSVIVSIGPAQIAVPNVTCFSFGHANAVLSQAGLTPSVGDPVAANPLCPNPNRVALQDPAAGTQVATGTPVVLHPGGAESPSPSETPSP